MTGGLEPGYVKPAGQHGTDGSRTGRRVLNRKEWKRGYGLTTGPLFFGAETEGIADGGGVGDRNRAGRAKNPISWDGVLPLRVHTKDGLIGRYDPPLGFLVTISAFTLAKAKISIRDALKNGS